MAAEVGGIASLLDCLGDYIWNKAQIQKPTYMEILMDGYSPMLLSSLNAIRILFQPFKEMKNAGSSHDA